MVTFLVAMAAAVLISAALLPAGRAYAGDLNAQQLEFFDDQGNVYSIAIQGWNQHGQWIAGGCYQTPYHTTKVPGTWWAGKTYVTTYSDANCTKVNGNLYIDVPQKFDGYYWRCLSDAPPYYSDWSCDGN